MNGKGFSRAAPNRQTRPNEKTAVQANQLDGGKVNKKSGAISGGEFNNTDLCTATGAQLPRIIAPCSDVQDLRGDVHVDAKLRDLLQPGMWR